MSQTASGTRPRGKPKVLATYECDEGTRQLVGERVKRHCRAERHTRRRPGQGLPRSSAGCLCMAELDGLIDDYLALAAQPRPAALCAAD